MHRKKPLSIFTWINQSNFVAQVAFFLILSMFAPVQVFAAEETASAPAETTTTASTAPAPADVTPQATVSISDIAPTSPPAENTPPQEESPAPKDSPTAPLAASSEPGGSTNSSRDSLRPQYLLEPGGNGSLVYDYPLTVPPGRNGMQPNLKLSYSSQPAAQNGELGYGWSVNIPYIERMNKLGTDKLFNQDKTRSYFSSSLSGELLPVVNTSPVSSLLSTTISTTMATSELSTLFTNEELPLIIPGLSTTTSTSTGTFSLEDSSSTIPVSDMGTSTKITLPLASSTPEVDLTLAPTSGTSSLNLPSIADSLAQLSVNERATYKGKAMAKIGSIAKVQEGDYFIEVQKMEPIDGGLQVFARAWDADNHPLGFGRDGSVEIERFRFFNPRILVPDGTTSTTSDPDHPDHPYQVNNYKEDLVAALKHELAHAVSVTGKEGTEITTGKIGNTTDTYYPDADPETSSVDGQVGFANAGANTWSTVHDGTANTAYPSGQGMRADIQGDTSSNKWAGLNRAFILFDTSPLADTDVVSSSTLSLMRIAVDTEAIASTTYNIYSSNPASNIDLVTSDYGNVGTTPFSIAKAYSSFSNNTFANWKLNASGLAAISTIGVSKFSMREATYDVANVAPTWSSGVYHYAVFKSAESTAGTTDDPKLVVEHSALPRTDYLLVNDQTNPVTIATSSPYFSALHLNASSSALATSYQIQITTSPANWGALYWDSGKKTMSSSTPPNMRSPQIYATTTFPAGDGTTYYWRIKFWDQYNGEGSWSTTGDYFAMQTTGDYMAKVDDGSFTRYTSSADGSWIAYDKRGMKYTFGSSTLSRLDNTSTSSQVYRWMLEKVQDPNGNSVLYSYIKDAGQIYPYKITYTNSTSTTGIYEVEFVRENRTDVATSSAEGFQVVTKQRIKEVLVRTNGQLTHRYQFGYTTGDNSFRSLLSSLTESGWDANVGTTTLPAVNLSYGTSTGGWTQVTDGTLWNLPGTFTTTGLDDNGYRTLDVNGDGLTDIVHAYAGATRQVYLNSGSDWILSSTWSIGVDFTDGTVDKGVRFADVNGDGLVDIVRATDESPGVNEVLINNGTSTWVASSTWIFPKYFTGGSNKDYGVRLVDINGDSLPDVVQSHSTRGTHVYLNTGSGWTETTRTVPASFSDDTSDFGWRFADVNGDGLVDLVCSSSGTPSCQKVYLNTGTDWVLDTSWTVPEYFTTGTVDQGTRLLDVNNDGLPDLVRAVSGAGAVNKIYFNTGKGWTEQTSWSYPDTFTDATGADSGLRSEEADGDNLGDVLSGYNTTKKVYLKNGTKPDLLKTITNEKGGRTSIGYQTTAKYQVNGRTQNPKLPFVLDTVKTIALDSGVGAIATTTYSYAGGEFYFGNIADRQFAGFASTTRTNALNHTTRSYFHQGNSSDSTNGEYNDHVAKVGRPYRIEVLDGTTTSANLYSRTINQWARADYGDGRNFVKLIRSLNQTFDGDSSHRDIAQEMVYDDMKGNLTTGTNWGEVTGNTDGTFTDTGSDKATTTYTYAASSTNSTVSLPSRELVIDQSGNTVKDTKWTYDSLSFGSVTYGLQTKEERLKSGSSYASTTKTYNSYGLLTQSIDPRGSTSTFAYDTFILYPATTTNALGQTQTFQYDYSSGKVATTTDENSRTRAIDYDGLDRPIREKQPDFTTPTTLVTKTTYTYTDSTSTPSSVAQVSYLNAATTSTQYSYVDGFGRAVQTRKEAKSSNTFIVHDFLYNAIGLVDQESLPYFASGASRTTATSAAALYSTYRYDPLGRITTFADILGTTTSTYSDWKVTVADSLGNKRDSVKDAYGNLATVVEYLFATSSATTTYTWNLLGKMTKLTDALANIRNFTYDNLGRLLTSEDLHTASDVTFGTTTYTYDNAGNVTTLLNPRNQTINYTYDALNRKTAEDYTGGAGIESTWGYDNCTNGKGRLCGATTSVTTYGRTYNPIGLLSNERKTIDGSAYSTTYNYDRLGNQTDITYPDASAVTYGYVSGGYLDTIRQKDNGGSYRDVIRSYDYNPLGQETQIVSGNWATTTNTYDLTKKYRLTNRVTKSSTTTVQSLDYTYDAVGNITTLVDGTPLLGKTIAYTYDGLYRLLSASTTAASSTPYRQTYSYDLLGNLLTKSDTGNYTYAGTSYANPDAVTSIVGTGIPSITFDAATAPATQWGTGTTSTTTWTHTTSGQNRLLVLTSDIEQVNQGAGTVQSATYGGQSLTKITTVRGGGMSTELWYLKNPPSGANIMQVVVSGATYTLKLESLSFTNVDQTAPLDTSAVTSEYNGNPDVRLSTYNPNDLIVANLNRYTPADATSSKTNIFKNTDGYTFAAASYQLATSPGNYTDTYTGAVTNQDWSMAAAAFKPVGLTTSIATATPTFVQGGVNSTDSQVTFGSTVTEGNLIVVGLTNCCTGTIPTNAVSDNYGNTYTRINEVVNVDDHGALFYAKNVHGGYNFTVYSSFGGTISAMEYSGVATSSPLDKSASSTGNSTSLSSGSVTTTQAGELAVGLAWSMQDGDTWTAGSGYTLREQETNNAAYERHATEDKVVSTASSVSATFTVPTSNTWLAMLATFKPLVTITGASATTATTTYTYDNAGNLTGAGSNSYGYDYNNRMTSDTIGATSSWYYYDADGTRVEASENGNSDHHYPNRYYNITGPTTTRHIFANGHMVATLRGTYSGGGTLYFDHTDQLSGGNVTTDTNGRAVETTDYYPFGAARVNVKDSTITAEQRKYIGEQQDTDSGLSFLNARYYDTTRGQFTSQDPILRGVPDTDLLFNPQALNYYSYAGNNPINKSDPSGLRSTTDAENAYINETRTQIAYLNSIGKRDVAMQMSSNLNALIIEIGGIPTVSGGNYLAPPPVENKVLGANYVAAIPYTIALVEYTGMVVSKIPSPWTVVGGLALTGVAVLGGYLLSKQSQITEKQGDYETAKEDFWAKNPQNVQQRPNGTITGELANGDKINVRPQSSDGRPTLEIQKPNGQKEKIRYGD